MDDLPGSAAFGAWTHGLRHAERGSLRGADLAASLAVRTDFGCRPRGSSAPLHLITILGFITLAISIVFSIVALVQKLAGTALGGFTTVIILLLFLGSIMMISLGIIGYYIARIYEEIKGRPRYIIEEYRG